MKISPIRAANESGVAIVRHRKTGQTLRYTIPVTARTALDSWNQVAPRAQYDAVMNAPQDGLFQVQLLQKAAQRSGI